jgi:ubiquinone/menaquinone biosynthesis C-methylase UbiE
MNNSETDRFQAFFKDDNYIEFKNYLYSYILRKIEINKLLKSEKLTKVLELGSGLSPLVNCANNITYSDLSFTALKILKKRSGNGLYVVADAANLPFKPGIFSHTVCSEVLEHIANDRDVLREVARVLKPLGNFIITFPHRKAYFGVDDRFVGHLRRYELSEMISKLQKSRFQVLNIKKVLGPVDKVTICMIIYIFSMFQKTRKNKIKKKSYLTAMNPIIVFFKFFNYFYSAFSWLDALIIPRGLSTVLMIQSMLSDDLFHDDEC